MDKLLELFIYVHNKFADKKISLKKRFYQYWTNVLLNKNMAGAVLITKNYGLCVMLYLYDWHFNFDRSFSNQEGKNIKFDHKCVNDPLMINKTLAFFCVIGPNVLRKSNNCDKNIVFLVQKKNMTNCLIHTVDTFFPMLGHGSVDKQRFFITKLDDGCWNVFTCLYFPVNAVLKKNALHVYISRIS